MFQSRIKKLRNKIKEGKIDAVFISSVSSIEYFSGYSNFSKEEREAYILAGLDFAYIITDGRYAEAMGKQVPHLTLFQRGAGTSILDLLKKHGKEINKLGIEEDNLTVAEHKAIKKHLKKMEHFDVDQLRSIKEKEEIEKIEQACKLGDLAFDFILKKIKTKVTEKQISQELENFIRQNGAQISFPAIVAFGRNSSIPHHQTGETRLQKGDFVLLDFGTKIDGYCSDMTRTIFFGEPTDQQKKIYKIVLEAQQKVGDFLDSKISKASLRIKSGKKVTGAMVDKVAREYIIKNGYSSIPHSLGHGIGLQVHEHPYLSPKSREELKEGMVFSIEPGIYIPDFGGVRIEDLYVVGKEKLEQITNSPKDLIIL